MNNIYKNINFHMVCPSNRPSLVAEVRNCLSEFQIEHFDGTGYKSYAKLINDVIVSSPHDIIFVVNDKMQPSPDDVRRSLDYLLDGFAMSWLWPFAFGCFHKDLIRRLGFFEERCSDGHYEDSDMIRRCREANIGMIMLHKSNRININTQWKSVASERFFKTKWAGQYEMTRVLPEQSYSYDIGPDSGAKFKAWADTMADAHPPATDEDNKRYMRVLGL